MTSKCSERAPQALAVAGSPRKGGNSDLLLDQVILGVEDGGGAVQKVYLQDRDLRPCSACDACQRTPEARCVLSDDMADLYEPLQQCDLLLLATPVYCLSVSAQMKLFLDRWYPLFTERGHLFRARQAIVCITYGTRPATSLPLFGDLFAGMHIPATFLHGRAIDKGEIAAQTSLLAHARATGEGIARSLSTE